MSWTCPHLIDGHCDKRGKPCEPGACGCVLHGKINFIGGSDDAADENLPRRNHRSGNKKRGS